MGWGAPCWEGPITCQPPQASLQSQELGHCSAHGLPRPQGLMGWGPGPHSDGPLPLQPPQGSLHGAARDLLQMGQLAARERPQVSRAGGGPRAGLGVAVPAPTPCAALSLDALSTGPRALPHARLGGAPPLASRQRTHVSSLCPHRSPSQVTLPELLTGRFPLSPLWAPPRGQHAPPHLPEPRPCLRAQLGAELACETPKAGLPLTVLCRAVGPGPHGHQAQVTTGRVGSAPSVPR